MLWKTSYVSTYIAWEILVHKSCSWSKWLFKHLFYEVHFSLQWLLFFIYFYISFNQKIKKKKQKIVELKTRANRSHTLLIVRLCKIMPLLNGCVKHTSILKMSHTWKLYHDNLWGLTGDGDQTISVSEHEICGSCRLGRLSPTLGFGEDPLGTAVAEGVTIGPWGVTTEHHGSLTTSPKYSQTSPRCHLCHLHWCFSGVQCLPQQADRSWMGCGDHCPQFLLGTVMALRVYMLVYFLPSVSRSPGIKSAVVSICCCIPASSVVDKLFHQPKITSSRVWTMKTLPTLVFSKRGTNGPKDLPVCFMSVFLEKANPQCFQIAVLKSEGGRKRQKTTLGQNSTEQIKQVMHRFMSPHSISPSVPQYPPCIHLSGLQVLHSTCTYPRGQTKRVTAMLNAL